MSLNHEFGIVQAVSDELFKSYTPNVYNCISVEDNAIIEILQPLSIIKTYFTSLDSPKSGLAYYGVTVIPPESLPFFLDVLTSSKEIKEFGSVSQLFSMVILAKEEGKYMIHYGI